MITLRTHIFDVIKEKRHKFKFLCFVHFDEMFECMNDLLEFNKQNMQYAFIYNIKHNLIRILM